LQAQTEEKERKIMKCGKYHATSVVNIFHAQNDFLIIHKIRVLYTDILPEIIIIGMLSYIEFHLKNKFDSNLE